MAQSLGCKPITFRLHSGLGHPLDQSGDAVAQFKPTAVGSLSSLFTLVCYSAVFFQRIICRVGQGFGFQATRVSSHAGKVAALAQQSALLPECKPVLDKRRLAAAVWAGDRRICAVAPCKQRLGQPGHSQRQPGTPTQTSVAIMAPKLCTVFHIGKNLLIGCLLKSHGLA